MSSAWYKFLDQVRKAESRATSQEDIWYRGHKRSGYKLVPSLYRSLGLDKGENGTVLTEEQQSLVSKVEKGLLEEFIELGGRKFVRKVFRSKAELDEEWSTLFDMQHYEVPTRLLDWTTTLGVALAFALMDRDGTEGAASVYVLDPFALNKLGKSKTQGIVEIREDGGFSYKASYLDRTVNWVPDHPIAIAPPKDYWNERMAKQYSAFTVHGWNTGCIEDMFPQAVTKVNLPVEALEDAERFLKYAHISATDIYPDAAGVARYLRKKYLSQTIPRTNAFLKGDHNAREHTRRTGKRTN